MKPIFFIFLCIVLLASWIKSTAAEPLPANRADIELIENAFDCLVEPRTVANVGSPIQGIVEQVLVDRGVAVRKDQAIVQMVSTLEKTAVEQAEARAEMVSEITTREADLELARLDHIRFADLYSRKLVSEQQLDEARVREQIANSALVQAIENRRFVLLELKRARQQLALHTIRSPITGVVLNQLAFPGEFVSDNPVVTVAELDPLQIEVVLPGRLFGSITSETMVSVHLETGDGTPLPAGIDAIDPVFDPRSGTFGVRLLLPNPDFLLPAGQNCRATFEGLPPEDHSVFVAEDRQSNHTLTQPLGAAKPANGAKAENF